MPSSHNPPIAAERLRRTFMQGETPIKAVDDVSLAVEAGELVAVMGPSGSGKSTLLHLLGGIDSPDEGHVWLEGRDIAALPERELALVRRRQLGFLLQFFSLLPTLSALENVAFPLLLDGAGQATERARSSLERVGMGHRLEHRPAQLSGGEQQRVALARALVHRPAVILADEPTGSLDSASGNEILSLLRAAADEGQAIVMVTHDPRASSFADHVVQIRDGRLLDGEAAASLQQAAPERSPTGT